MSTTFPGPSRPDQDPRGDDDDRSYAVAVIQGDDGWSVRELGDAALDSLADATARWWALDALRAEPERLLASLDDLEPAEPFAAYVRLIDSWRVLPYVDPGLPVTLLPDDWPGERSVREFDRLSRALAPAALAHARDAAGGS